MKGKLTKPFSARWLLLAATLFHMATSYGQCDSLPLPYSTDFIEGFTPSNINWLNPWDTGATFDNCWMGYCVGDPMAAMGSFGLNPGHCILRTADSSHDAAVMLVAPAFDSPPASIRMEAMLEKWCSGTYDPHPCPNYCVYIEFGWVLDTACPMESFVKKGTLCFYTINNLYPANEYWPGCVIPIDDTLDGRFALRLQTKLQPPLPSNLWSHPLTRSFHIRLFEASKAPLPLIGGSDTVWVIDSVCQYSAYNANDFSIDSSQTADTGAFEFSIHDYEIDSLGHHRQHVKILILNVLPSDITIVHDSIRPGDAYVFGGEELTLAGNHVIDLGLNAYGCPIKDSLELSISQLPSMECGADIGVEQTEWYILQPVTVHLWAEKEAGSYLWSPSEIFDNDTSRDVYFQLPPDSEQRVGLTVERLDTVNHIYRGTEMDTVTDSLMLQVPVESRTRYRLEMTLGDGTDVPVQVSAQETLLFDSIAPLGQLSVELFTYQYLECVITIIVPQAVRMTGASLYRFCHASDSVLIVSHIARPIISAARETICEGDTLHLTAEQTDYYAWSSRPYDTALDAQQGQKSVVVSPRDVTTYYLLGSTGEVADSLTVTIELYPQLRIMAEPEVIDFDNPVLTLEERSEEIAVSMWAFSDGYEDEGRKVRHKINVILTDSVWVMATGCTLHGCCSDTTLTFPVEVSTVWFPNVFTPDAEENNRFGMVASKDIVEYKMYIYNRNGLLVWSIDSYGEGWNGRDLRGNACPQESYAYTCDYRLANGVSKRYTGTVLLLR